MIVVVMGVSGSGKTTIGIRLAEVLGWPFYDGDDFHPPENVAKMRSGVPLTDADRAPWLSNLRSLIRSLLDEGRSAVLTCSALRRAYRAQLQVDEARVRFVYLKGSFDLIRARLQNRTGHFMPPALLASQFAALEEPEAALVVTIDQSPDAIVHAIRRGLGLRPKDDARDEGADV